MKTIVGIATLKIREESFKQTILSLYDQVDSIAAVLNLYEKVPEWLKGLSKVECILSDNSLGDAGKFWYAATPDRVYLACDDDLLYPKGYVSYMLSGVEKYNGLVSLHGRKYLSPVTHFKKYAYAYRCLGTVTEDVPVNFIGSGCCAFDTNRLELHLSDFRRSNMADVWLSKAAKEQGVPMVVLKHDTGYLKYITPKGDTIWNATRDYSFHTSILRSFI